MTIYIEYFLIENILINFCLLKLIYISTKSKTSFFKMLLSSIIGATFSIFAIIILNNNLILNITKILTALLMISVAFKQSKKQFVTNFVLLFIYTYVFGGLMTSFSSHYLTQGGTISINNFTLEIICFVIIIFTYIFEVILKHVRLKVNTSSLLYSIELIHNNNSIKINAYLDTGNFLNYNGQPVLILDLKTYLKLTKTNLIEFLTAKSEQINTHTVSGNKPLKIFKINEIKIYKEKNIINLKNQLIAINTNNCFKNTNYQALLSPLFL